MLPEVKELEHGYGAVAETEFKLVFSSWPNLSLSRQETHQPLFFLDSNILNVFKLLHPPLDPNLSGPFYTEMAVTITVVFKRELSHVFQENPQFNIVQMSKHWFPEWLCIKMTGREIAGFVSSRNAMRVCDLANSSRLGSIQCLTGQKWLWYPVRVGNHPL